MVKIAWSSILSISLTRKVKSKPHYDCFACSSSHSSCIFDAACTWYCDVKFDCLGSKQKLHFSTCLHRISFSSVLGFHCFFLNIYLQQNLYSEYVCSKFRFWLCLTLSSSFFQRTTFERYSLLINTLSINPALICNLRRKEQETQFIKKRQKKNNKQKTGIKMGKWLHFVAENTPEVQAQNVINFPFLFLFSFLSSLFFFFLFCLFMLRSSSLFVWLFLFVLIVWSR